MALQSKDKAQVSAAREDAATTSTHFQNETTRAPEDSGQSMINHQVPEMLVEPGEEPGGSTHFANDEKFSEKTNRMNGNPTTAAKAGKEPASKDPRKAQSSPEKHPGEVKLAPVEGPKHPAKANLDNDAPDVSMEPVDSPEGPATDSTPDSMMDQDSGTVEGSQQDRGQSATQVLPNDEDPTAGYITTSDVPNNDGSSAPTLPRADSGAEFEDRAGDTKQPPMETPVEADETAVDEFDDMTQEPGAAVDEVEDGELPMGSGGEDEMPIVDIDGTDDEDCDDVVFANVGTDVLVLKGNRTIASMTQRQAVRAGCSDYYQSANFAEVTSHEMGRSGLRAGLKGMGFALASVNLAKADVLNKRVEAKAKKLTAGLRAVAAEQQESMEQCMAIAAVGINRAGYFKDVRNELRASLESEFAAAGVRNADKLIRRVFASHGVEYAKAIITIANQLSEMPVEVRNAHASSLDMCGDEDLGGDDALSIGDDFAPNMQNRTAASEDEFVDEFESDSNAPVSVQAALMSGYKSPRRQQVRANNGRMSVTAASILSGSSPLAFAM